MLFTGRQDYLADLSGACERGAARASNHRTEALRSLIGAAPKLVELDTLVIIVTLCEINFQTLSAQLRAAYVSRFDVLCESKIMLRCSDSSAALSNLSNCHRINANHVPHSRSHQQHPSPIPLLSLRSYLQQRPSCN